MIAGLNRTVCIGLVSAKPCKSNHHFAESREEESDDESNETDLSHIASVGNAMSCLYQMLREHNQCAVAFHYLMGSLGATLVHVAVNKEARPVDDQVSRILSV